MLVVGGNTVGAWALLVMAIMNCVVEGMEVVGRYHGYIRGDARALLVRGGDTVEA